MAAGLLSPSDSGPGTATMAAGLLLLIYESGCVQISAVIRPVLHTFHPFLSPCVTALSESVTSHVGSRPPPAPLSGGAHSPYDNTSVKATPQWPG